MLLRNYDNIMLARMCPNNTSETPATTDDVFGDGKINVKDISGNIKGLQGSHYYWYNNPFNYFTENRSNDCGGSGYSNLICGSGSTSEHYDDYKLETPFTNSQISSVSGVHKIKTPVYDETTGSWTFTYTRNFLANEDITVMEIGVLSSIFSGGGYYTALTYRKVLETPLEVKAGNQFTLTFTATLSANPNKPADYDANAVAVE